MKDITSTTSSTLHNQEESISASDTAAVTTHSEIITSNEKKNKEKVGNFKQHVLFSSSIEDLSDTGSRHGSRFKRNRSTKACEVCHRRKVRCDAMIHIPCTNCLTFGSECRFPESKKRKKSKIKSTGSENDLDRQNLGNNNQSNQREQPQHKQRSTKEPQAAISARVFNIDSTYERDAFSTMRFFGSSSSVFYILQDKQQADEPYLTLKDSLPSAITEIMDKAKHGLDSTQIAMLKIRGSFRIPEQELCDDLIRTYFEEIYPIEPLIDKEDFMTKYEQGTVSLLLLQSVLLAASCVSNNEALFDSEGSKFLCCSSFYKRAKALYDSGYENDPIVVIQSLVMFLGYWDGFDDVMSNSYYWTRVAISIAQGFGFHREIDPEASSLSISELKTAKLLFWYLYIRDVFTTVGYGRPGMINLDNCDVKMPTEEDFPKDVPKVNIDCFLEMLRLSELTSIVFHEQYSVRAERLKRKGDALAINHCDMLMSSWRNSLKPELQYSPQKDIPYSVCILNLYYYYNVSLVHRALISKPNIVGGNPYPSEGIVFKASRIIADICSTLMKRDEMKYSAMYMVAIVFNACTTFVIYKDYGNPVTLAASKVGYDLCFEALKQLGKKFRIAEFMRQGLFGIENDPSAKKRLLRVLKSQSNGKHPTTSGNPIETSKTQFESLTGLKTAADKTFQNSRFSPIPTSANGLTTSSDFSSKHSLSYAENPDSHSFKRLKSMDLSTSSAVHSSPDNQGPYHNLTAPADSQIATGSISVIPQMQNTQPDVEFPDFYLFTHNLTSTNDMDFDPSDLFPNQINTAQYSTIQTANLSQQQQHPQSHLHNMSQAHLQPPPAQLSYLLQPASFQHPQPLQQPQQHPQQQPTHNIMHHQYIPHPEQQQQVPVVSWASHPQYSQPVVQHPQNNLQPYDLIMDPSMNLQELHQNLSASHNQMMQAAATATTTAVNTVVKTSSSLNFNGNTTNENSEGNLQKLNFFGN